MPRGQTRPAQNPEVINDSFPSPGLPLEAAVESLCVRRYCRAFSPSQRALLLASSETLSWT
jgi:hypothetical protein